MIQEAFVEFETAKLLEQAGFPQYESDGLGRGMSYTLTEFGNFVRDIFSSDWVIAAPTQAQAMRWLREEHGIFIMIMPCACWCYKEPYPDFFEYELRFRGQRNRYSTDAKKHRGYENTIEIAIRRALKIIINSAKRAAAHEEKGGEQ